MKKSKGFTLIELLVVISIIALLIAILLPSLSAAREQSKAVACGVQLKTVGSLLAVYSADNRDYIPGTNTTGVAIRALAGSPVEKYRNSKLPVQSFDWISPLLRMETEMPKNRAERFKIVTDYFSCNSQRGLESELFGAAPDMVDFQKLEPWTTLSYLMPSYFQYWGQSSVGHVLARNVAAPTLAVSAQVAPTSWEVITEKYTSKIGQVGSPAKKIAVADGTRYLTSDGVLDHDISPAPTYFGSFTASSGWWSGSTEYGPRAGSKNWDDSNVTAGAPGGGQNLNLSYRHLGRRQGTTAQSNKGAINAVFFDGHVQRLTDRESRSPEFWYPTGSKYRNNYTNGLGMTNIDPTRTIP